MNSRERVLAACNHKEGDRIPIDCGAMRSTGLSAIAFKKLNHYLGFDEPCLMFDYAQQLAYVGETLRKRFHVDAMDIGEAFIGDIKTEWKPWRLSDGSSCLIPNYINVKDDGNGGDIFYDSDEIQVGKRPKGSLYPHQDYFPYEKFSEIPEILNPKEYNHTFWSVPSMPMHLDLMGSDEDYKKFVRTIKEFRAKSDKCLMIGFGGNFFEMGGFIRKPTNWLCDILVDPEGTERLICSMEEQYMDKLNRIFAEVWDDIDVIQFGDDWGTQRGPWINPEDIRRIFKPHYKKMWDFVHSKTKAKIFLHSCGSIAPVLGDLIDVGLDIISPVQTTADNMDPIMLKKEFGKDITFWGGGCECQGVLSDGTPEQVADQVKRRMEIFGKDGGFVFNQIHNILDNVPAENVVAMYDTAYKFGNY